MNDEIDSAEDIDAEDETPEITMRGGLTLRRLGVMNG
jgi:hypothetical protein